MIDNQYEGKYENFRYELTGFTYNEETSEIVPILEIIEDEDEDANQ